MKMEMQFEKFCQELRTWKVDGSLPTFAVWKRGHDGGEVSPKVHAEPFRALMRYWLLANPDAEEAMDTAWHARFPGPVDRDGYQDRRSEKERAAEAARATAAWKVRVEDNVRRALAWEPSGKEELENFVMRRLRLRNEARSA